MSSLLSTSSTQTSIPCRAMIGLCVLLILFVHTLIPVSPASAAADEYELRQGHADIGIVRQDETWTVKIKDDSSKSVAWRDPTSTRFRVSDAAEHTLPESDEHSFLGQPGTSVYIIPQTQAEGVLWLGWNTQHSSVLKDPPSKISISMHKTNGPGHFHVYLDYGGFRPAEVLWGDDNPNAQVDVPVNTHAHGNWAFSEPGMYDIEYTATVTESDGTTEQATTTLQFLVGDETDASTKSSFAEVMKDYWWLPIGLVILGLIAIAYHVIRRRSTSPHEQ